MLKKDFEWNGPKSYYVIEIVFESIEKKVYDEIRDLMPEGISILKYVNIVKNEFDNFKNKNECKRDQNYVFEENDIIDEIVKSCNNTICINNYPIFTCDEDENIVNRYAKKRSRDILLNYLGKECQEEYYKLEKWDDLFSKIEMEKTNTTSDRKEEVKNQLEGSSQEFQDGEPKSSPDIEGI
ncbi:unnamed protein product [Rhizophagus irregularis]|nr:unnamed protein product [Rhizophagus irregularis]CAB5179769.1 unnamed protein product [Rhizophagus irregularis]